MNETEFLNQWQQEKPIYEAWGNFVLSEILNTLIGKDVNLNKLFKNTPEARLKDNESLINKAFYREKQYKDPYKEIEDKVGLRFVVLLIEEINLITNIIESSKKWEFEKSRHFETEREESPLLFTYQSVHYIVRSKEGIDYFSSRTQYIADIPCEIQIRTILQHAYAELTHDSVYKSRTVVEPEVQRTIAKSMALIETTDDFFSAVNNKLSSNSYDLINFQKQLDDIYRTYIDANYDEEPQKSNIVILDVFKDLINEETVKNIKSFIIKKDIKSVIQNKKIQIYGQSIVLFLFYLIRRKTKRLVNDWPLNRIIIQTLATDIGVSIESYR